MSEREAVAWLIEYREPGRGWRSLGVWRNREWVDEMTEAPEYRSVPLYRDADAARERVEALVALVADAEQSLHRAVRLSQVLMSGPVYGIQNHKAMARALESLDAARAALDALDK
jgi:hypothetical protein